MPDPCDYCNTPDCDFGEHDANCPNAALPTSQSEAYFNARDTGLMLLILDRGDSFAAMTLSTMTEYSDMTPPASLSDRLLYAYQELAFTDDELPDDDDPEPAMNAMTISRIADRLRASMNDQLLTDFLAGPA
jgi:hypothetical protein